MRSVSEVTQDYGETVTDLLIFTLLSRATGDGRYVKLIDESIAKLKYWSVDAHSSKALLTSLYSALNLVQKNLPEIATYTARTYKISLDDDPAQGLMEGALGRVKTILDRSENEIIQEL